MAIKIMILNGPNLEFSRNPGTPRLWLHPASGK